MNLTIYNLMQEDCPNNFIVLAYRDDVKELESLANMLADNLNMAVIKMTEGVYALVIIYDLGMNYVR